MKNDKFRMTKEIRNPNDEGKTCGRGRTGSTFVLRPSFGIRHSDFVIFRNHEPIYELRITIYALQSQITLGDITRVLQSFKSAIVNRKSKI
ncbi:MAG: hypothetical protein DME18_08365 [Verrucomicrobia bacterium]|nr:MAG: hypothetical protein DME18_08365 [Verrucomicrobiota bacterium]